jgi:FtsZ-binding cell division protein ZapB
MIKKEHRLDTIAWLIITVICVGTIAGYMLYGNIVLKSENNALKNNVNKLEQQVDSLEAVCDTLKTQNEVIEDYCFEVMSNYEDEISFLGHSLDKHNIHPDYSNLGR